MFSQEKDVERTVGINTGHIGTLDYGMEDADREFVVAVSMLFLIFKYYINLFLGN